MYLLKAMTAALASLMVPAIMAQVPPMNGVGSTPAQRFVIDQNQTTALLAACVRAAQPIAPENCAVTDPAGLLVGFIRMDNAFPGSIDVAIKKARTGVLFNGMFNSAQVGRMAQPGQPLQEIEETNGGLIAFGGGFPVYYQNHLIGGIGASGATVAQDSQIALAAIQAAGFQTNAGS